MKKQLMWIILIKKQFNFQRPSGTFKILYETKDKTKNDELVNVINSGLKDLKIRNWSNT